MRKIFYFMLLGIIVSAGKAYAQEILPSITVKNFNGKIIVSWRNEYPLEVKTINIQRSFDSSKNFSTIGSVLNPQNIENGFVDERPPYNKMYYRVFISFDAGAYIFSESVRPVKYIPPPLPIITQPVVTELKVIQPQVIKTQEPESKITPQQVTKTDVTPPEVTKPVDIPEVGNDPFNKADSIKESLKFAEKAPDTKPITIKGKKGTAPVTKKSVPGKSTAKNNSKQKAADESKTEEAVKEIPKEIPVTYPSKRIYTSRDNNVVISLPNFDTRRYVVKFFDENDRPLFEMNRIKEDYLIIEKVNFLHAGWFYFEIFENGKLIEKNKFFISR